MIDSVGQKKLPEDELMLNTTLLHMTGKVGKVLSDSKTIKNESFGICREGWESFIGEKELTELEFCTPRLENLAEEVLPKSQENCISNET